MKKILFALGALCACAVLPAAEVMEEGIVWTYTLQDGSAVLTGPNLLAPTIDPNTTGPVTVPEEVDGYPVTAIGDWAFYGCRKVTSVTIPDCVKTIGTYVFASCSALESAVLPEGLTELSMGMFSSCRALREVKIPSSVTTINWHAFSSCTSLEALAIPEAVTTIAGFPFDDCPKLKLTVADANPSFCADAGALFSKDRKTLLRAAVGVANYTIPDGVTALGQGAFYAYEWLTSVTVPASVETIPTGRSVFYSCSDVKFTVAETNPAFASRDGALLSKDLKTLLCGPGATAVYTVPEGVEGIAEDAFYCYDALTSLTLPEGVTEIGESAFAYCPNLRSVTLPATLESIADAAFGGCGALTSITIPARVTAIGYGAFEECESLESVAFLGCSPLVDRDGVFPETNGYYLLKYAAEWEANFDDEGRWDNLTMTAVSAIPVFPLTVTAVGAGEVTGNGSAYNAGESVTVTARPAEGWVFCGWNTDPVSAEATCTLPMPAKALTLTAYFAPAQAIAQHVAVNGLLTRDAAKQALLETKELFTADALKAMAFGSPLFEVEAGDVSIGIALQTASGELETWEPVSLESASVTVDSEKETLILKLPTPDHGAAFYKFVVPDQPEKTE